MPGKCFIKSDDPEVVAEKRKRALANLAKAHAGFKRKQEMKMEKLAQFVAFNPFSTVGEICTAVGLQNNQPNKVRINNALAQPSVVDKINAYKQECINPLVSADIGERYRTLAIQAVEKAQQRLYSKDCKDNTLVEILRVCSQYLAPKNAAVQINAGAGSLVGVLSELQSSAQEQLAKPIEKLIASD